MADTYGWELLYQSCVRGASPLTKQELLTMVVHWTLTRNGFQCHGLDVKNTEFDGNATGSEALPVGWRQQSSETAIRYTAGGKRYLMLVSPVETDVIYNLLRMHDHVTHCVRFNVADTVRNTQGSLPEMVPGYQAVVKRVHEQLVATNAPAATANAPAATANTGTSTNTPHTGRVREPYQTQPEPAPLGADPVPLGPDRLLVQPPWGPVAVGRADLDPLGGGGGLTGGGLGGIVGGGNVFDPFSHPHGRGGPLGGPGGPTNLPPGAVPPGARFDPFGPLAPGRGGGQRYLGEPDPDEFGPPM